MSETKVDEVVEELKARMEANRHGEEGRLPSLRELAEQMKTSRETINKAVQLLQSEGWLYSKGRSIYVQLQRKRLPTSITLRFDLALKEQRPGVISLWRSCTSLLHWNSSGLSPLATSSCKCTTLSSSKNSLANT